MRWATPASISAAWCGEATAAITFWHIGRMCREACHVLHFTHLAVGRRFGADQRSHEFQHIGARTFPIDRSRCRCGLGCGGAWSGSRGGLCACHVAQGLDEAVLQQLVHHGFQLGAVRQLAAKFAQGHSVSDAEQDLPMLGPQGVAVVEDFFLALGCAGQLHSHFHGRLRRCYCRRAACAWCFAWAVPAGESGSDPWLARPAA